MALTILVLGAEYNRITTPKHLFLMDWFITSTIKIKASGRGDLYMIKWYSIRIFDTGCFAVVGRAWSGQPVEQPLYTVMLIYVSSALSYVCLVTKWSPAFAMVSQYQYQNLLLMPKISFARLKPCSCRFEPWKELVQQILIKMKTSCIIFSIIPSMPQRE